MDTVTNSSGVNDIMPGQDTYRKANENSESPVVKKKVSITYLLYKK